MGFLDAVTGTLESDSVSSKYKDLIKNNGKQSSSESNKSKVDSTGNVNTYFNGMQKNGDNIYQPRKSVDEAIDNYKDSYVFGDDFYDDFRTYSKDNLNNMSLGDFQTKGTEDQWKQMVSDPRFASYYESVYDDGVFNEDKFHDTWNNNNNTTIDQILEKDENGLSRSQNYFGSDNEAIRDALKYANSNFLGGYGDSRSDSLYDYVAEKYGATDDDTSKAAVIDWTKNLTEDQIIDAMAYEYAVNAAQQAINGDYLDRYRNNFTTDDINNLMSSDRYMIYEPEPSVAVKNKDGGYDYKFDSNDKNISDRKFDGYYDGILANNAGYFYGDDLNSFVPVANGWDVINKAYGDNGLKYTWR